MPIESKGGGLYADIYAIAASTLCVFLAGGGAVLTNNIPDGAYLQ